MVALPLIKLFALGARQVSRPIARGLVSYATEHRRVTFTTCIGFGRLSLGLSSVIAEWSRKETLQHEELLNRKANGQAANPANGKADASANAGDDGHSTKSRASSSHDDTHNNSNKSGSSSNSMSHDGDTHTHSAATVRHKVMLETDSVPVVDAETTRFMQNALAVATGQHSSTIPSPAAHTVTSALHSGAASSSSSSTSLHGVHDPMQMGVAMSGAPASSSSAHSSASTDTTTTTTPRSRSLIQSLMYGPQPQHAETHRTPLTGSHKASTSTSSDEEDEELFANPHTRTRGEVARLFIRYPYRSTWYVFRKTFYAPFPQQQLLDAGAELLVEILVFTILVVFLYLEMQQTQKNNSRKEAYLEARFLAIESKINELIDVGKLNRPVEVKALAPQEEFSPASRIDWITYPAYEGVKLLSWLISGSAGGSTKTQTAAVAPATAAAGGSVAEHKEGVAQTPDLASNALTEAMTRSDETARASMPARNTAHGGVAQISDNHECSINSRRGCNHGNSSSSSSNSNPSNNINDTGCMNDTRSDVEHEPTSLLRRVMNVCRFD